MQTKQLVPGSSYVGDDARMREYLRKTFLVEKSLEETTNDKVTERKNKHPINTSNHKAIQTKR